MTPPEIVRITARIPADLHAALADRSTKSGLSINQIVVDAVAAYFGEQPEERPVGAPAPPSLPSDKLAEDLKDLREWVSGLDERVSRLQELAGEGSY
jgi:hypothetical protein